MIEAERLANLVGTGNVTADPSVLASFARDVSFANAVRPAAVVRPSSADEVKQLVKLANETGTPLVPVSSGAPHFKGDTVPGAGGSVVVDLSGMKKIRRVDRLRRVAMVEPGVTFEELIPAAKEVGIRLNMPLLPRKSKSVLGSILEREPVLMPKYQWDISDPACCFEVIFGTGDDFRTGQAAGPGTVEEQEAVGGVQKSPLGPGPVCLHRLIQGAQGTMGIATWASIRCELRPKLEEAFVVGSSDIGVLLEMAGWLVRLRAVNECFILNSTNLAMIFAKDWPAGIQELRSSLPDWTLFYVVAGYDYLPEERINSYIDAISEVAQRYAVVPGRAVANLSAVDILKAVQKPCDEPYWKLRYKGASEDIPFLSNTDKLKKLIPTVNNAAGKAGYPLSDLGVYIQPIVQGTSLHCECTLFYDPDNKAEARRTQECSTAVTKALLSGGAFFSRPYGENADLIMNRDATTVAMLNKLKDIFDPNKVMNPGKLCW